MRKSQRRRRLKRKREQERARQLRNLERMFPIKRAIEIADKLIANGFYRQAIALITRGSCLTAYPTPAHAAEAMKQLRSILAAN